MISSAWFAVKLFFAGAWPMVLQWGTLTAIAIVCVVLELCAGWLETQIPIFGKLVMRFRIDLIWVAICCAVIMGAMWVQAHDDANRYAAKAVVVVNEVHTAVAKSKRPKSIGHSKWTTDQ